MLNMEEQGRIIQKLETGDDRDSFILHLSDQQDYNLDRFRKIESELRELKEIMIIGIIAMMLNIVLCML